MVYVPKQLEERILLQNVDGHVNYPDLTTTHCAYSEHTHTYVHVCDMYPHRTE